MNNWNETVLSQYANSPTILAIIENLNDCLDPSVDLDNFYSFLFNIDTAIGFGLDNWGKILRFSRSVQLLDGVTTLDDDTYRTMLKVKALANITATNAPSLNKLLTNLFKDKGRIYTIDIGNMQMLIVYEFDLSILDFAILQYADLVPHPAGVQFWLLKWDGVHKTFFFDVENDYCGGFDESYLN